MYWICLTHINMSGLGWSAGLGFCRQPRNAMTAPRFSSLAGFLGVKAFPDIEFPRYNSIGGHRTDLCRNMTLVPLDERLWGSVTWGKFWLSVYWNTNLVWRNKYYSYWWWCIPVFFVVQILFDRRQKDQEQLGYLLIVKQQRLINVIYVKIEFLER